VAWTGEGQNPTSVVIESTLHDSRCCCNRWFSCVGTR